MSTADRKAWSDFWAAKEGNRQAPGCLPAGLAAIDAAQEAVWRDFAGLLPRKAAVLDLGSGDGAVMRRLISARGDLKIIGVDFAPDLPPPPKGTRLRYPVDMEALPFPDRRFDAVTSQFAFEYGDHARVAAEVARVLKPGGKLCMIVHRSDGPIVAHNLPRREGLGWVLDEQDLIGKARSFTGVRAGLGLAVPPAISAAVREAAARFGQGSVAVELSMAVERTLAMGARQPAREVVEVLAQLDSMARNEMGRIDSLCRAACSRETASKILNILTNLGVESNIQELMERGGSGRSFAWLIRASR